MRRTFVLILVILLVLSFTVGLAACTSDTPTEAPATEEPTESGSNDAETVTDENTDPTVALIESKCSLCHTTERVWAADYDKATWAVTIDRMKANGLIITDDDYTQIVDYLSGL